MPALSADPAERERWFAPLADVENRRREPWVLEGLSYLHHPLRAGASAKYVAPSLELLREIQQTGDIFFPDALDGRDAVGAHRSTEVADGRAAIPRPSCRRTIPPRLRNIILQSADELFRVAPAAP